MSKSTKPKSATSYKDTAKGILPRPEVILLEQEGVKRALEVGFAWVFPNWRGKFRTIKNHWKKPLIKDGLSSSKTYRARKMV